MTATEYQGKISSLLRQKFPNLKISKEWVAFRGVSCQYAPRVDIAIGPFSIKSNDNKIDEYDLMLSDECVDRFLHQIYNFHLENVGDDRLNEIKIPDFEDLIHKNRNARCFLAFEIENSSSRKHIIGSVINAASLGRIGVGVAYNDRVKRTFLRILNYLAFLKRVEKNTYDTTNFLIITKDQLEQICR